MQKATKEKRGIYGRVFLGILAYSAFLELCVHLIIYNQFRIYDNWRHEIINHIVNISPLIIMTTACVAIIFILTDRGILARKFWSKLLVDTILSIAATYGAYVLTYRLVRPFISKLEVNYGSILAVVMITILIIELLYYMRSTRQAVEKAEQSKRMALQYQYDAFRGQVNPHFLFNSLNILMDIIESDKDKAREFTERLSDIYRYVLSTHRKSRVMVSEEISFIESYIHILTLKYNNFLTVGIHKELKNTKYIIPFTMQILLENVTKHNVISDRFPMNVDITINEDGITVKNRIMRKKNDTGTGLGLKYILTQYKVAGKDIAISDDGEFFTAEIPYL